MLSLNKKPLSEADLDAAQSRVWSKIESKIEHKESVVKKNIFSLIDYKLYAPAFAVAAALLIVFGFALFSNNDKSTVAINGVKITRSASPSTIATTSSPQSQASSSAAPTQTTDQTELLAINVDENLVQFNVGSAGASAGIRAEKTVTVKSWLPKAIAAGPRYPVVYYTDWGHDRNTEILEINIYTGSVRSVVKETSSAQYSVISRVSFNQATQTLAYVFNTNDNNNRNVILYDLNKNERRVLAENLSWADLKWSPNNQHLAVVYKTGNSGETSKTRIYTTSGTDYTTLDTPNNVTYADNKWSSDSKYFTYEEQGSGNSWFSTVDISTNEKLRDPEFPNNFTNGENSLFINGMMCAFMNDVRTAGEVNGSYWFATYDRNTKSYTDYKETSVHAESGVNWIAKSDLSEIIYIYNPNKGVLKINKINLNSRKITEFNPPNVFYNRLRVVGWNGNENNLVLWDYDNKFWNLNVTTGKIIRITR